MTYVKNNFYDTTIRLLLLLVIIVWCLLIFAPFVHIMLWGLILAIALEPIHTKLSKWLKGSPQLASVIIVLIGLAIIMLPSWLFLDSIISGVKILKDHYQDGTLSQLITDDIKNIPVIGSKINNTLVGNPAEIQSTILKHKETISSIGKTLLDGVLSVTSGMFQVMGALVIAGVLLVVNDCGLSIRKFFWKAAGKERGDEFATVVKLTVSSVVKGILGVAFIQALLTGIGFVWADVPYAGLWTLIVFVFALLQLPPAVIVIPVIVYIFKSHEVVPSLLFTIYLGLAGLSDNILKPILLGKGAPVPMVVIFIGVIGGFVFSGFIGMFSGAIVFSIGYKLFESWINSYDEVLDNEIEETV